MEQVQKVVGTRKNCTGALLDVKDEEKLDALIGRHSIVISLIPANLHIFVAKSCLRVKRHLVTTSYISPEMQALSKE